MIVYVEKTSGSIEDRLELNTRSNIDVDHKLEQKSRCIQRTF